MAKRPVSLRVDEAVLARARKAAARRKWTPSFLMAEAIEAWVDADERRHAAPEPFDGTQRSGDTVLMAGVPVTLTGAPLHRDEAYPVQLSGSARAIYWRALDPGTGEVLASADGPVLTEVTALRQARRALARRLGRDVEVVCATLSEEDDHA